MKFCKFYFQMNLQHSLAQTEFHLDTKEEKLKNVCQDMCKANEIILKLNKELYQQKHAVGIICIYLFIY